MRRKISTGKVSAPHDGTLNPIWEEIRGLLLKAFLLLGGYGLLLVAAPTKAGLSYFVAGAIALFIAVSLRWLHLAHPERFNFGELRQQALARHEKLERHQKLYVNVVIFIVVLAYSFALDREDVFPSILQLFVLYCIGVAAYDILRVYRVLSNSLLGKGLLAVGLALGTKLAFAFSSWTLGEVTREFSTVFPHTHALLAIGMIPVLFVLLGAIYLPISILLVPFALWGSMVQKKMPSLTKWLLGSDVSKPERHYVAPTLVFQALFYLFMAGLVPKIFSDFLKHHEKQIESAITRSIYVFDMYPAAVCKLPKGYRVAPLRGDEYLVGQDTEEGVKLLQSRKCP